MTSQRGARGAWAVASRLGLLLLLFLTTASQAGLAALKDVVRGSVKAWMTKDVVPKKKYAVLSFTPIPSSQPAPSPARTACPSRRTSSSRW